MEDKAPKGFMNTDLYSVPAHTYPITSKVNPYAHSDDGGSGAGDTLGNYVASMIGGGAKPDEVVESYLFILHEQSLSPKDRCVKNWIILKRKYGKCGKNGDARKKKLCQDSLKKRMDAYKKGPCGKFIS